MKTVGMVSVMDKQLIPAGYKQTEVGVIPEGRKVLEIQEISKIGRGTTPARIQGDRYLKMVPTVGLRLSINH